MVRSRKILHLKRLSKAEIRRSLTWRRFLLALYCLCQGHGPGGRTQSKLKLPGDTVADITWSEEDECLTGILHLLRMNLVAIPAAARLDRTIYVAVNGGPCKCFLKRSKVGVKKQAKTAEPCKKGAGKKPASQASAPAEAPDVKKGSGAEVVCERRRCSCDSKLIITTVLDALINITDLPTLQESLITILQPLLTNITQAANDNDEDFASLLLDYFGHEDFFWTSESIEDVGTLLMVDYPSFPKSKMAVKIISALTQTRLVSFLMLSKNQELKFEHVPDSPVPFRFKAADVTWLQSLMELTGRESQYKLPKDTCARGDDVQPSLFLFHHAEAQLYRLMRKIAVQKGLNVNEIHIPAAEEACVGCVVLRGAYGEGWATITPTGDSRNIYGLWCPFKDDFNKHRKVLQDFLFRVISAVSTNPLED